MDRDHRTHAVGPALLIVAGIAAMVAGITRWEAVLVLMKAIRVCLECVGIG